MTSKILLVDDDPMFTKTVREILKGDGYEVETASTASGAIDVLKQSDFDVVLLDFMMPKMSGLDALSQIRGLRPTTKIIMITAFATIEKAVEAIRKGAADYIAKPFKIPELLLTIRRVLEEAKFEEGITCLNFDQAMSSIASPFRRNILKLLMKRGLMRLTDITRQLDVEDHTKVVFHLKILKECGVIEQGHEKKILPDEGGAWHYGMSQNS